MNDCKTILDAPAPAPAPATAPALAGAWRHRLSPPAASAGAGRGVDAVVDAYGQVLGGAGGRMVDLVRHRFDAGAPAVALYAAPPYDLHVPAMSVSRLSINLSPARVTGGIEGERPRVFQARRHSLFLTPAGAAARWRKDSPSRHVNIYFDARALGEGDGVDAPLPPTCDVHLVGGGGLFDTLVDELMHADDFAAEAIDSLARLVLVRLMRQLRLAHERVHPVTPAVVRRLTAFVSSRLEQRLQVADLAAEAGLAPNRFAQAFVAATGYSPHQFVLSQRLQRAAELLRQGRLPLAEVAAACGFASQQHLTRTMRRRLGTTPARYRGAAAERSTD